MIRSLLFLSLVFGVHAQSKVEVKLCSDSSCGGTCIKQTVSTGCLSLSSIFPGLPAPISSFGGLEIKANAIVVRGFLTHRVYITTLHATPY